MKENKFSLRFSDIDNKESMTIKTSTNTIKTATTSSEETVEIFVGDLYVIENEFKSNVIYYLVLSVLDCKKLRVVKVNIDRVFIWLEITICEIGPLEIVAGTKITRIDMLSAPNKILSELFKHTINK